jgi:hypothetical protein
MPPKNMHFTWFTGNLHKIVKTLSTICVHCNKLSTKLVHSKNQAFKGILFTLQKYD